MVTTSLLSLRVTRESRLMVLAPHPDDEALGAGGLLQIAAEAGAAVRVVFVTDGENNPWPQRWMEKRWFIDADCRRRWGAQRRLEALASMRVLGLNGADAIFAGLPDQGMLPLWRRRDAPTQGVFSGIIREWRPTILVLPSEEDRHPDHRGVHAFAREAVRPAQTQPLLYSYLIHRGFFKPKPTGIVLSLTPQQQNTKLNSILCHETQTLLSHGRFTAYATPTEIFTPLVSAG